MTYKVYLSSRAERTLKRSRGRIYLRLQATIKALSSNPRPHGCCKLSRSDEWRIRVGVYRIRYRIDDARREITVTYVGHRREVYR